jgi:hypothetical protein
MKSRPARNGLTWLLAFVACPLLLAALTPTEWSHRQALTVPAPGLVRVDLPPATFDAAAFQQEDLRVVDASGRELASLLDDPPVPQASTIRAASFEVALEGHTTVITLSTGTKDALASVSLETPHPFFLRAARVEISDDADHWTTLDQGLPLFRQWGAEKLELPLGNHVAAFVRIVVSDNRATALPFTGARLRLAAGAAPALVPVGAKITRRDEFAGETVLTLALDGRHLPLAALEFDTSESLFTRRVTVTVREVRDAVPGERTVGAGTVYRVALEGAPNRAQLELPLNFTAPTRELLVHIHNGDSPPLALNAVRLKRWPVSLLFLAPAAGNYALLSGNPQARAPRYDLAGFAGEMRGANATAVVPGELESTPHYQPRESLSAAPLPDIPLTGAPLDTSDWTARRAVFIDRAGVQELELDLEALARSRPDYADLRIVREGNQIPYVLEQPALARSLLLSPISTPDPKRPTVSVWQLRLPQSGPPLRRLVFLSSTPLFQREFRIYEKLTTPEGHAYEATLASGNWSRTPEPGVLETRIFDLTGRPQTDTLWIETDNGDNPAIALGAVQTVYPVVRLIFKVADPTSGFALIYGNKSANAPRYDLSLVAVKLLTSSRTVAKLAPGDPHARTGSAFANLKGGTIFWAALALVVIVLLVVVAKLLPKPPAA